MKTKRKKRSPLSKNPKNSSLEVVPSKYKIERITAPLSLGNNPQKHLLKFQKLWQETTSTIKPFLDEAFELALDSQEIKEILVNQTKQKISNYFDSYSPQEQKFLILSYLVDSWLNLIKIILEKNWGKLTQLTTYKRENLLVNWLYYQVFKTYFPELEEKYNSLWSSLESLIFYDFDL